MNQPNYNLQLLSEFGIRVTRNQEGTILTVGLSEELSQLLLEAREGYAWPLGKSPLDSQRDIIQLEEYVSQKMQTLSMSDAQDIVLSVSEWAGIHGKVFPHFKSLHHEFQNLLHEHIKKFRKPTRVRPIDGIYGLNAFPGIGLSLATKVCRFCLPSFGAGIDRHSSYFFNSLRDKNGEAVVAFGREWVNNEKSSSRLAIENTRDWANNPVEYTLYYLPLLRIISKHLNSRKFHYKCAATGESRQWRPCDVEMAADFWWAQNGTQ